jgi:hypothetical protein
VPTRQNFHKRRRPKQLSKNEEKVRRGNARGLPLSQSFPQVEQLDVELSFASRDGVLLSEEHRTFTGDDPIDLSASCPGRCGEGKMDLEGKVRDVTSRREERSESRAVCPLPIYGGSSEPCACELRCRIEVRYRA